MQNITFSTDYLKANIESTSKWKLFKMLDDILKTLNHITTFIKFILNFYILTLHYVAKIILDLIDYHIQNDYSRKLDFRAPVDIYFLNIIDNVSWNFVEEKMHLNYFYPLIFLTNSMITISELRCDLV